MSAVLCAADNKAIVSTTIDFQDIVMGSPITQKSGYYPLEQYEKEIKNLADAGMKKIYLRTDAIGQRYHPNKLRDRYSLKCGGDFWNWN